MDAAGERVIRRGGKGQLVGLYALIDRAGTDIGFDGDFQPSDLQASSNCLPQSSVNSLNSLSNLIGDLPLFKSSLIIRYQFSKCL
jgi:hypothetical protein